MQSEILCFILVSSFNICPLILSFKQCDFTVLRRTTSYGFCEGSYISQHSNYVKSYLLTEKLELYHREIIIKNALQEKSPQPTTLKIFGLSAQFSE